MLLMSGLLGAGCSGNKPTPPDTRIEPVTDVYHGVEVVDNYRWLENGDDPEVKAWDIEQDRYTRSILDAVPYRSTLEEELRQLYDNSASEYSQFVSVGDKLFALKLQPPKDQDMLVRLESPLDSTGERIIVDPNEIDSSGRTAIDFFSVSHDGSLVAVSMSEGGTEDGNVSVYRVEDGRRLTDYVTGVNGPTAGGDVAWLSDNSGFFYTRYPHPGERPDEDLRFYQQVYFHRLGTPEEEDHYVIGKEFPSIAEIEFETSPDGRYIVAVVANGDGGEYDHWLRQPNGQWERVTRFEDEITTARFDDKNRLCLLSSKNADMRQILRLPAGATNLAKARTVVTESDAVIEEFLPTDNRIYVVEMIGGPMQLRVYDDNGAFQKEVPIRPVSAVSSLTRLEGDRVMYYNSSYVEPGARFVYEAAENRSLPTTYVEHSPADFSNVEVSRETAVSRDGTAVPMTILKRRGTKLDGSNPTILYGYGGYGLSETPGLQESISLWLNRGGIYVYANIRGGAEFGEQWHKQGYLTDKQNVFDDFAACAQHLIDSGYTLPERLAIRGGSNGGLLVGAVMVQHPELFKAVVCEKGVLDALRSEFEPNGVFNTTEFGSVRDPEQFKALYAYSPYANVKDGVNYPDVLFTADVNDGRVDASNSRKMTARLQAVKANRGLTLLRIGAGMGHGMGMSSSDRIAQDADVYTFLFDRLGLLCK